MLHREIDPVAYHNILNHPEVMDKLGLPEGTVVDQTERIANQANVCLMNEEKTGCLLFEKLDAGLFEIHIQFLPEARGPEVLENVKEAFHWMFTNTEALELVAKIPLSHTGARQLAIYEMELIFTREGVWPKLDGSKDNVEYYSRRVEDWVLASEELELDGKKVAEEIGLDTSNETAHNCWLSFMVACLRSGQMQKGVVLYNRFAVLAGVGLARLVGPLPKMFAVGNLLTVFTKDKLQPLGEVEI